jgi:hypothetical protein
MILEFPQFPSFNTHKYLIITPIPILVGDPLPAQGGKRVTSGASEKIVRKLHLNNSVDFWGERARMEEGL